MSKSDAINDIGDLNGVHLWKIFWWQRWGWIRAKLIVFGHKRMSIWRKDFRSWAGSNSDPDVDQIKLNDHLWSLEALADTTCRPPYENTTPQHQNSQRTLPQSFTELLLSGLLWMERMGWFDRKEDHTEVQNRIRGRIRSRIGDGIADRLPATQAIPEMNRRESIYNKFHDHLQGCESGRQPASFLQAMQATGL